MKVIDKRDYTFIDDNIILMTLRQRVQFMLLCTDEIKEKKNFERLLLILKRFYLLIYFEYFQFDIIFAL